MVQIFYEQTSWQLSVTPSFIIRISYLFTVIAIVSLYVALRRPSHWL